MKIFHYAVFLGLLAVGIGWSVLLVPHQDEVGLLYFKGRQYPEARRILEQRLAAGEHSIDVVVPLAEIYVQSGDVERALALLRRSPVRPEDRIIEAERIGRFEQYGQLTKDYLRTLEKISRLKRSEETLRELADLYRYFSLTEPLAGTLQDLIAHYAAEPADFIELANLEAIGKRFPRAVHTLEELSRRHPDAVTGDTVEFLISVLLDAGETARAEQRAKWWLARHSQHAEAVRLAGLLESRGMPEPALRLLEPFADAADRNPQLLAEWINLLIATGAQDAAFKRLQKLRQAGGLPQELAERYLELALERRDLDSAIGAAEESGLEHFPNWLLANLAEAAVAGKRDAFVHRMTAALREDFLSARPLLGARLALARGDHDIALNWLRRAASDSRLRDADRLAIASNYQHLGRREEALEQLSQLRLESLDGPELVETARVYENLGKAAEGLRRFESLRAARAAPGSAAGWALLAAGTGHGHEALAWLMPLSESALSEDELQDLYYAASDHGAPDLAAECARRLYKRTGSDTDRLHLATALAAAGDPCQALLHLRALVGRGGLAGPERASVEEAYTAALRAAIQLAQGSAAQPSPPGDRAAFRPQPGPATELRSELRKFWSSQLKRADLEEKHGLDVIYGLLEIHAWDEALPPLAELAHRRSELLPLYVESAAEAGRKQDAVTFLKAELNRNDLNQADRETRLYALIEQGGYDVALPYLSRMAWSSSGRWAAAYEDALTKLGRMEELSAFWRSQAARPGVAAEEKRMLAFKLLDAGRKNWALPIFLDLARSAKPGQQEVSDLLFLWGPIPDREALAWLEQRARESTGEERAAWWQHLLEAGATGRVVAMAAGNLPEAGRGGATLETYLHALARLGNTKAFAAAVARESGALDDAARAISLARLARESGIDEAAETAYSRALALAPRDPEALHWLGMYAFARASYSAAEARLRPLLEAAEGSYEDNFYYAELLWRKGDRRTARIYYGRALRAVERIEAPPPQARAAYAQSLARYGFLETALAQFRNLLTAEPDNSELRADFAALLIENSRYEEARQVLARATGANTGRLIELRAQLLSATSRKPEAFRLLEGFVTGHPDQARALASLASLDAAAGRQRQARSLLAHASSLEPENEDFELAIEDLDREQAPRVQIEATRRSIEGAQSEDLLRVMGEQVLGAFRLHFETDQDIASVRSVRSPKGAVAPFEGILRRGEASVQYELADGTSVGATLYGSDAGPGVAAGVSLPGARGTSALRIEYGKPDWDFAESLAGGGTRDRVVLREGMGLGPRASVRLGIGLNRYNLQHVPNAAASVAGQAGLAFRILARPNVSLEYNFDGEYKLSTAERSAPGGATFHPLPLVSREVHAVSAGAAGKLTRNVEASVAAGFAVDRLGGRAPFVSLSLKYGGRGRLGAAVDFDRRLYFLDTARTVDTIGGHLNFRF